MQTHERPTIDLDLDRRAAPPSDGDGAGFLFGVAISDHQAEAFDPRHPDIWDLWEERMGMTPRGRGTDFWNRYAEDIELAGGLGCKAFRFSISWARVEPRPGEWNREALEHYAELVRCIRRAGMEPVVTLMHWVWPAHVEERGGLVAEEFPQWFVAFAAQVAEHVGEGVRYWITFNEPNALPFGYIRFWWQRDYPMPPGTNHHPAERQVADAARVIRNLFRAHAAARSELRSRRPEARVSANPCVLGLPGWVQRWLDRCAERAGPERRWRASSAHPVVRVVRDFFRKLHSLGTLANPNWWHLGMAGRLPTFLCPAECVGQQDYTALDYYWGIPTLHMPRVVDLLGAMQQQFGRAPVWARGLYHALRRVNEQFPDQEILIAENGCPGREDGLDRLSYLQRHVGEVMRARRHGVPVIGYLCWSITTCREWGLPEEPNCDFGLYRVDLDGDPELRREATEVSQGFRDLVASITRAR